MESLSLPRESLGLLQHLVIGSGYNRITEIGLSRDVCEGNLKLTYTVSFNIVR